MVSEYLYTRGETRETFWAGPLHLSHRQILTVVIEIAWRWF